MPSADLLTAFEACERRGVWSRDWRRPRLDAVDLLRKAIHVGLTTDREDFGDAAGEAVMDLAENPGMIAPASHNIYESVVHHAALADILTTALRPTGSAPWRTPEPLESGWTPSCYIDPPGGHLRRIVLATSWSEERHYRELRSWYAMGETAMYGMPMTMAVLVLGSHRQGRRNGPWARGFLHPFSHQLRFRRKTKVSGETFNDKWEQVWREDRGNITTKKWLQAMLEDDILRDVCFTVDMPLPEKSIVERVSGIAAKRLNYARSFMPNLSLPPLQLSTCAGCVFEECCWSSPGYHPNEKTGFVRVNAAGRSDG